MSHCLNNRSGFLQGNSTIVTRLGSLLLNRQRLSLHDDCYIAIAQPSISTIITYNYRTVCQWLYDAVDFV